MKVIVILLVLLVVAAAGVLAVVYSGVYNVGTGNHDNALMNWVLDTSMTHSVQRHARGISAPPLSDPAMIQLGAAHYREMCAGCHGAPGITPAEIAQGLWPEAPDLAKTAGDWTPAQLYWIIKNGLKFTSMPAWGPSHSEKELWAMTAFVQQLPRLSPAGYKAMQDKATQAGGMNMHE
jgi:mono/diheme cytochrome c family protein